MNDVNIWINFKWLKQIRVEHCIEIISFKDIISLIWE